MRLTAIGFLCAAFLASGCDSGGSAEPVANSDRTQTRPGEAVTINVLANDTGTNLTVATFQARSANGGVVTRAEGERLTYQPRAGFLGTDFFTYVARDDAGLESKNGTVTVVVQ